MRTLTVVLLTFGCTGGPQSQSYPNSDHASGTSPKAKQLYVAPVRQAIDADNHAPGSYCVNGESMLGAQLRVGRLPAFASGPQNAELLLAASRGAVVIVEGQVETNLWRRLRRGGTACGQQSGIQARSDMTVPEGGVTVTRESLARASYLRVDRVVDTRVVTTSASPDKIEIRVKNPLPQRWQGTIIAHYEGGAGKPMPYETKHKMSIAAGRDMKLIVPDAHPGPKRPYSFARILIESELPQSLGSPFEPAR